MPEVITLIFSFILLSVFFSVVASKNKRRYHCKECDKYLGTETPFCAKCGNKGTIMYTCCGKHFNPGDNFCPTCGKKVKVLKD
ncbi:MAG: hypothetical protein UT05_C0006G0034 [Parcubacteria group bacterium GW2011_GWF2_38_76]|nr:MAG: hypothetical protein UT05_C0006G0034 [Parcubacteria group bacterium GW2011_GWF2_38_76]